MIAYYRALRFIIAQQRADKPATVSRRTVELPCGSKRFNADIYELRHKKDYPVIVFLHGMSPLGITDPRQVAVAEALAYAGFRVFCPELSEIRNLQVRSQSIERFALILKCLLADAQLCPHGRFALFAPSFSGAICLKVAADPALAERITAVAAIGAFSRIERSLAHLMYDDTADPYARLVILANFLPRLKEGKKLGRYYLAAAHDNWHETAAKNPALAHFETTDDKAKEWRRLGSKERQLVKRIEHDKNFRVALGKKLLTVMQDTLDAYNVAEVAAAIKSPVFLLHGAGDDVIPPRESVELFPQLREAHLVVTPLMGHSDAAISLKMLGDVFRLVRGFAWFFRKAVQ